MYKQVLDPVGDSLGLTSIFAAIPIVVLFVLLGGLKMKAHWASLIALATAIVIALAVYSMPLGQALDASLEGAAFGIFPIMWIVFVALWIYNMTVDTGYFAVLRRAFNRVSDDQRVQAVIIAFCFGALLEALAGFGTPVAITASMLMGLGFKPIKAASIALVSNTAPVAFGAIAIPIVTLPQITGLPKDDLGAMVGRQTPLLARDRAADPDRHGRRHARHPAGLAGCGRRRSVVRHRTVRLLELPLGRDDRHRRLAALRRFDRRARPGLEPERAAARRVQERLAAGDSRGLGRRQRHGVRGRPQGVRGEGLDAPRWSRAFSPYILIIVVFAIGQWGPVKDFLDARTYAFQWPGIDVLNAKGEPPSSITYKLNWANAAGTLLLVAGLLSMIVAAGGPGSRAARLRPHGL